MLSNTAVPKYYEQFRNAVMRGEIPVCREISMEMNRIDKLIRNPAYYFDNEAVEGWIAFCEDELVLRDGSDFHMLLSFKLWGEQVFGWYEFIERSVWDPVKKGYYIKRIKRRLINKQYLIVGRGAAKTLYSACIQGYFLICDRSTTKQVSVSFTMNQAEETLSYLKTAIARERGPLIKFLTEGSLQNTTGSKRNRMKLSPTKKGIENFLTNSLLEVRPMNIDALQGRGDKIATIDEWLSGDIRENPIGAIEQGSQKISNYLIMAISSEGTVRNSVGDTIKMNLSKILRQEYNDPHTSIWWYKLDDIKEVEDPSMWLKANPNIGYTVTWDTYEQQKKEAEENPSERNDILAKRFGIPMEGFTYFFTYEETLKVNRKLYFDSMPCSLGIDLSQGGDFCSFTFMFPITDGSYGIKSLDFISDYTLTKLPSAMRQKYDEFINEESLIVLNGTVLDMQQVYDLVDEHIIKHEYDVRSVGFDPYNAKEFMSRWVTENGEFGVEKVIQGSKTESVPLTEIKKLAEQRLLIFDQELFSFTMGNCIVIEDTNGNKKLMKKSYDAKIDAVAAFMDAFIAYKLNKEAFE